MDEGTSVSLRIEQMIALARQDPAFLGHLLERYRPFLLLSLRNRVGPRLGVRCSPSDIVQQAFAKACQAFDAFAGVTEPEFSAWIKQINDNTLKNAVRDHVHVQGRTLEKEQRLHDADATASFYWREPAADEPTPRQIMIRGEKALRLAAVLESLPEMQREAVRLRHLEGCSLEETAKQLDRSLLATAGLIKRGLQKLRQRMSEESWS